MTRPEFDQAQRNQPNTRQIGRMPPRGSKPLPRQRLFRQTPPAVFPSVLGLVGLGVAWRGGHGTFGQTTAVVKVYLGATSLLFLFALVAYAAKVIFRPGVIADDLAVLPGRAGLAAVTMCIMLFAAVLVRHSTGAAVIVLLIGLVLHAFFAMAALARLILGPADGRVATPAMHLTFVRFIVAPLSAEELGFSALSGVILWYSIGATLLIWAAAARPLLTGVAPPPLRPLQAIHLAPAALAGTAAYLGGDEMLGAGLTIWASALFVVLVLRVRWLTIAGFSGFWGAVTFPAVAISGLLFLGGRIRGERTASHRRPDLPRLRHSNCTADCAEITSALGKRTARGEDQRRNRLRRFRPFLSAARVK